MTQDASSHPISVRGWSLVIYRLPSTPSTARVTVWKRVKELGALPLQQSVYVLPNLPELKDVLKDLKEQVQEFGGECKILEMASLEDAQEQEMIAGFNALRDQEYEEIIEECKAFDQEIDKETRAGKFYFAEEEEIEKRLEGLNLWFDTVVKRDFFRAEMRSSGAETLSECRIRLDAFSQEVFSREQALAAESKVMVPRLKTKAESTEAKTKLREVHSIDQLLTRLKEVVKGLEGKTLKIGEKDVNIDADEAILEMKYKTREDSRSLEIQIDWQESKDKPE